MLEYLKELRLDVYPQPEDSGHAEWARDAIFSWSSWLIQCKDVLDVGCGVAFVQPWFEEFGLDYIGVCLGEKDYEDAVDLGRRVVRGDFHNLSEIQRPVDFIFSRHSLEHSPMPLLALMEWHRVCNRFLGLVLPNPEYFGWAGRNHYSVMNEKQASFLLDRAGWKVLRFDETEPELRFICLKVPRPVPFYEAE